MSVVLWSRGIVRKRKSGKKVETLLYWENVLTPGQPDHEAIELVQISTVLFGTEE